MDEIKFRCPQCAQKLAVTSNDAGRELLCPVCGATSRVPAASGLPGVLLLAGSKTLAVAEYSAPSPPSAPPAKPKPALVPIVALPPQNAAESREIALLKSQLETSRAQLQEVLAEREVLASQAETHGALLAERQSLEEEVARLWEMLSVRTRERDSAQAQAEENWKAKMASSLEDAQKWKADARSALEKAQGLGREKDALRAQVGSLTSLCEGLQAAEFRAAAEFNLLRAQLEESKSVTELLRRQVREIGVHFAESERERILLQKQLSQSDWIIELENAHEEALALRDQLAAAFKTADALRAERDRLQQQREAAARSLMPG